VVQLHRIAPACWQHTHTSHNHFATPGFLLLLNVEDFLQGPITSVSQEMCRTRQFYFWKISTSPNSNQNKMKLLWNALCKL